jgi:wobble nucleotide-excising tRNase
MPYQATIDDWLALLGLSGTIRDVFSGYATIDEALTALNDARATWPGVSQDYVAVIDAVKDQVNQLADVISDQNTVLDDLNRVISDIRSDLPDGIDGPEDPPRPVNRLLTQAERDLLDRISRELQEMEADVEAWADDLETAADEAEQQAQDAQDAADEADQNDDGEDDE